MALTQRRNTYTNLTTDIKIIKHNKSQNKQAKKHKKAEGRGGLNQ